MNTYSPQITTQADLELAWRHLMGPFGYDHRSVWWMLIRPDDHPIPHLAELEDADDVPGEQERDINACLAGEVSAGDEVDGPSHLAQASLSDAASDLVA